MPSRQLLSRRRFLTVAAGSAVTCSSLSSVLNAQSKPSAPSNLRFDTPTKTLLGPTDFAYLGSFYLDNEGYDSGYQRGLTHRYVSGSLRLYVAGLSRTLYEHSIPDLKTSDFSNAPLTNNFGNLVGSAMPVEDPASYPQIRGLYWDEPDQRMYWTFMPPYTAAMDLSCLGYSTLNDASHACSGIKAVKMPPGFGYKWVKGITPIPSWFSSQYTKGYRLGAGFGGYESLMGSGGNVSLGPVLMALDSPDISATAHQENLTRIVKCVGYSCQADDRTAPWRGRRDKDYYFFGESSWQPGAEPYGWFTWADHINQSGYWIDTGTKQGFFVLANLSSLAGGSLDHLSSEIVASTTSSCTLAEPIPGLRLNDYVVATGLYKPIQVTSIDATKTVLGLSRARHTGESGPLPSAPTGRLTRGSYYVDASLASVAGKVQAFAYDPSDLSKGAMEEISHDTVQWKNSWLFDIPWMTQPTGSWWSAPYSGEIYGLTFDSKTNLLFVMVQSYPPIVSVYKVG